MTVLTTIRQTTPLVLNLANAVTIGDVANGLIALGAAPIMSSDSNESTEMVAIANAVAINLGTLNPTQIDQMHAVWKAANAAEKPVVFDPVGIGALKYRLAVAQELLAQHKIALIRGNAAEIAALAGEFGLAQGVDAQGVAADIVAHAKAVAQQYSALVVATGAVDVITDGTLVWQVANGTPALAGFSGTGDMLSSFLAAGLGAGLTTGADVAEVVSVMGVAGELTADKVGLHAPGAFRSGLFDTLAQLTDDVLVARQEVRA
ncbi:MAG TPA: hydroxyethylthiazole kinase [Lactobacillaceae bacterium]|jgi:hydroxyethylthiazole kinase